MAELPDTLEDTPTPSPADDGQRWQVRSRRLRIAVRVAIGIGLALLVLVGIDVATSQPAVCRSCHAMEPRAASWAKSTHVEIPCVACHQPPTEWYELPQRLVGRARLLGRDVAWQLNGRASEEDGSAETSASTKTQSTTSTGVGSVSSANCLVCHDVNRKATSGFRILIDHPEHAKRNKTCLSCHVNTGHPEATRGTALSLMDQCFTCHGTPEQPKASAECRVCHPADYDLKPASHEPKTWQRGDHGDLAKADPQQCRLCHEQAFCTDCHGLEMPHPARWSEATTGQPSGHAQFVETDREVCARCHVSEPDVCGRCHHEGWEPARGPWTRQHPSVVDKRGFDFCMECHTLAYCSFCHVKASTETSLTN